MADFISNNLINILLVIVGTFAMIIYILQERRKVTDAASLIVLQVDELQDRVTEIQSYIVDNKLNETAFYESQTIFGEDYWNQYKHYFVRKMDFRSFKILNSLYECAIEIKEQQQLMKNLQRNFFFVKQQVIANLEANYIVTSLNTVAEHPVDAKQVVQTLIDTMPSQLTEENKEAVTNMLHQFAATNENMDFTTFWNVYNNKRADVIKVMNQNGLTEYIPLQIRLSLEKAINQYKLLEVTGCDGYRLLKKVGSRKL